jgi:hypothetical protein
MVVNEPTFPPAPFGSPGAGTGGAMGGFMEDMEYANRLAKIADAYEAGEISRDEWRRQMAKLRDRKLEHWRQEKEAQGQGREAP